MVNQWGAKGGRIGGVVGEAMFTGALKDGWGLNLRVHVPNI